MMLCLAWKFDLMLHNRQIPSSALDTYYSEFTDKEVFVLNLSMYHVNLYPVYIFTLISFDFCLEYFKMFLNPFAWVLNLGLAVCLVLIFRFGLALSLFRFEHRVSAMYRYSASINCVILLLLHFMIFFT